MLVTSEAIARFTLLPRCSNGSSWCLSFPSMLQCRCKQCQQQANNMKTMKTCACTEVSLNPTYGSVWSALYRSKHSTDKFRQHLDYNPRISTARRYFISCRGIPQHQKNCSMPYHYPESSFGI